MFEMVKRMRGLQPNNTITQRYFSVALTNMVKSLAVNGKFDEALEMANENLELVNRILADDKGNKEANFDMALAMENFSDIYFRQKDYRKAAEYELKTLEIDNEIYKSDKQNNEVFIRINTHHEKLAEIYKLLGNVEKSGFHKKEYED